MNERIRELLKKAQKITAENYAPGGRDYEREIYSKFAESVIMECAKFLDEKSDHDDFVAKVAPLLKRG